MLFHLQPSVEMTGGPWFTDNELDTEFIKQLLQAVLSFIKQRVAYSLPLPLFSSRLPTSALYKAQKKMRTNIFSSSFFLLFPVISQSQRCRLPTLPHGSLSHGIPNRNLDQKGPDLNDGAGRLARTGSAGRARV